MKGWWSDNSPEDVTTAFLLIMAVFIGVPILLSIVLGMLNLLLNG